MFKKEKEDTEIRGREGGLRRNNTGLGLRNSVNKKGGVDLGGRR